MEHFKFLICQHKVNNRIYHVAGTFYIIHCINFLKFTSPYSLKIVLVVSGLISIISNYYVQILWLMYHVGATKNTDKVES